MRLGGHSGAFFYIILVKKNVGCERKTHLFALFYAVITEEEVTIFLPTSY